MKTLLRNAIADIMHASGASAVLRGVRSRSLAILCYHRILPGEWRDECPFPDLVVTPEAFADQVEYCSKHYDCLPLKAAVDRLQSGKSARRPVLTFTFDDGYRDSFEYARPILNAHSVRATFFVISSLVGSETPSWYDGFARALKYLRGKQPLDGAAFGKSDDFANQWLVARISNPCKWPVPHLVDEAKTLVPQVRTAVVQQAVQMAVARGWRDEQIDRIMTRGDLMQLAAEGHEVASHTRSHAILPQLSPAELALELEGSRSDLSAMIGETVTSLSYPNGDYDENVVLATHRAGYRYAVTIHSGLNGRAADPLRLRRVFMSQERLSRPNGDCSTNILELELIGVADRLFLRRWRNGWPDCGCLMLARGHSPRIF